MTMKQIVFTVPMIFLAFVLPRTLLPAASPAWQHRIIACRSKDPITLDGILNEPAWQKAVAHGDFTFLGARPESASPRTSVKILTDGTNLFLGFLCSEPDMGNLKAPDRPRDGEVFHDDSVELILDPTNEKLTLYHFIASASADAYDTSGTIRGSFVTEDKAWNGSWQVAVSKDRESWFSEWSIPLSELGVKGPFPVAMGLNLCRTRPRIGMEYSSWSPCRMRFNEPDCLGELILPTESGEYCFIEFSREKAFPAGQSLPDLEIWNFYKSKMKLFFISEISDHLDSPISKIFSEIFSVPGNGHINAPGLAVPKTFGPQRLTIRLIDADSGQILYILTRDLDLKPEIEIIMKPPSLYYKRIDAVVNLLHPDAAKPGARLTVTLHRDDETKTLEKITKEPEGKGDIPVSFSLEGEPPGRYRLMAELRQAGRIPCSAFGASLSYTPDPEIGFTTEGFLKVEGKPFFPVGMYTLQSRSTDLTHDDVLAEARAAGFNTTVFYAYKLPDVTKLLDAAARNDMRAFIYASDPYKIRKGKWASQEIEQDIQARMNHPALLGWYLVDEPEGIGETSEDTLKRFYETVKGQDMRHPCSLVIMSPRAAGVYGDFSDIVWVDPYPVPDLPVTLVSESLEGVRKAVGDARPVWAVLQAFDWNIWRKGAIDRVHRPTPEEERCMTYLALVHGAKGVIFWAHTASRYYIRNYPEHWNVMKRLAGELRTLTPVLLGNIAGPKIQMSPPDAPLDIMVRIHEDRIYVIAVNRESIACEGTFTLENPPAAPSLDVLFENRTVSVNGNAWKDAFQPLAVHVYRFQHQNMDRTIREKQ